MFHWIAISLVALHFRGGPNVGPIGIAVPSPKCLNERVGNSSCSGSSGSANSVAVAAVSGTLDDMSALVIMETPHQMSHLGK